MSRNIILSLATAATVAVAALSSQSADARGFGGGGFGGGRGFGGGGFAMARMGGVGRIGGFPGHGGGRLIPILNPGHDHGGPIHPIFPRHPRPGHGWVFHDHHHGHWVFRGGRWIVMDDVAIDETPVLPLATPVAPGLCTCLTKTYTRSGLVVFADVCTKESASAPVDATVGDASQTPTTPVAASAVPMSVVPTVPNYAGRTYEDYIAANPQAATPVPGSAQKN
jgi:hypothetical protein